MNECAHCGEPVAPSDYFCRKCFDPAEEEIFKAVVPAPDGGRTATTLEELMALGEQLKLEGEKALAERKAAGPEALQPQPEPEESTPVEGYENRKGWLFRGEKPIIPYTVELLAHVVEKERIVAFRVKVKGRPVEVPAVAHDVRALVDGLVSRTFLPWTAEQAKAFARWLTVAANTEAPQVHTVRTPQWAGDWLLVPGVNAHGKMRYYGERAGNEQDALAAWRYILRVGLLNPEFAVLVGAAFAAPFVRRFNLAVRGFLVHIFGEQNRGKTSALRIAAAAYGCPREDALIRDWNATENALLAYPTEAGILPVFLDDTSKAQRGKYKDAPDPVENFVYRLSSGRDKGRAVRDGTLGQERAFEGIAFSTGEAPILAQGKTGLISRVVELEAPLVTVGLDGMAPAETQARALSLAAQHYGWPLHWLVQTEWEPPDRLTGFVEVGHPLERASDNFAACAAGWGIFEQVVELYSRSGRRLAETAFNGFRDRIDRLGTSQVARFYKGLPGWALGMASRIEDSRFRAVGDVIGKVLNERDLALTPKAFKEACRDIGVDPEVVLTAVDADGRLLRGDSENRTRVVKLAGKSVRCYVFKDVFEPDEERKD